MVRLRTEKWYSLDGQRRMGRHVSNQSGRPRRVFSLVLLLILTIALIRKLSDPSVIENAFESLGVPLKQKATDPPANPPFVRTQPPLESSAKPTRSALDNPSPLGIGSDGGETVELDYWAMTCNDLIPRLLQHATATKIGILSERCYTIQPTDDAAQADFTELNALANQELAKARTALNENLPNDLLWLVQLDRFNDQWRRLLGDWTSYVDLDPFFRQALANELDRLLIEGMRSGAPWVPSDNAGFWRLLQRGLEEPQTDLNPPLISTQQLDRNFSKFRGQWIRYQGSVRRAERVNRSRAGYPIDGYWVLWLRGADQSSQPVAVYTARPQASQFAQQVPSNAFAEEGDAPQASFPEVEVVGIVAKRLAYSAESGIQVAPTLFAGSITKRNAGPSAVGPMGIDTGRTGVLSKTTPKPLGVEPPWASLDATLVAQTLKEIIQARLQTVLTDDLLSKLELPSEKRELPQEAIVRTLFSLNQVGWQRLLSNDTAIDIGKDWRMEPIQIEGWAVDVKTVPLTESQQLWYTNESQKAVHALTVIGATTDGSTYTVLCDRIPHAWQSSDVLKQPVRIVGYGLSPTSVEDSLRNRIPRCVFAQQPEWLFLGDTIEHVESVTPSLKPHWQDLARAGWDLAWLDVLAANDKKSLAEAEKVPFRELLRIVSDQPLPADPPPIELKSVLKQPSKHLGQIVDWKVRLVRGTRVELPASDGGESEAYYQFDGFVETPGQAVRYVPTRSTEALLFEGEFPITVVMAEANQFVPRSFISNGQQSWNVGQYARVRGRFYRLWSYESERVREASSKSGRTTEASARQVAPLVMAATLEPAMPEPFPTSPVGRLGYIMAGVLGLVLAGILLVAFRDTFRKKTKRSPTLTKSL